MGLTHSHTGFAFGCFRSGFEIEHHCLSSSEPGGSRGILRCVGFILQGGPVLNLAVSLVGADAAQVDTKRTLREEPTKCLSIWSGHALAH